MIRHEPAWLFFAALCTCVLAIDKEYYYDYSGDYDYGAKDKSIITSPPGTPTGNTFEAFCDRKNLFLSVRKSDIPTNLQVYESKWRYRKDKCVRVSENSTNLFYKVALDCPHAIKRAKVGSSLVYHHNVLFIRNGAVVRKSNPYYALYTAALECEVFYPQRTRPVGNHSEAEQGTRVGLNIYEHRVTSGKSINCKRDECPYGALCLDPEKVDGIYCICGDIHDCKLTCPKDYYGCEKKNVSTKAFGSLQKLKCINNGWLCDRRFDCPLKDDETSCAEVWSLWGTWTKCSASCGQGRQTRKRLCDISFTKDPERCKLKKRALGCSRKCVNGTQEEKEDRACKVQDCSVVTCNRHRMTVVIPREPEMTQKGIEQRMMMGNDPSCVPSFNDTHVIFVTMLDACNTTSQTDNDTVVYRNHVVFKVSSKKSSVIMRDVGHSYSVSCRFNRRRSVILRRRSNDHIQEVAALEFSHENEEKWDLEQSFQEHHASGNGEFDFKMELFHSKLFSTPYTKNDYPLRKRLRQEIYIGVGFESNDVDLKLVADKCKATPTKGVNSSVEYVFIEDGCPVDDTVEFYEMRKDFVSFSIQAFKFANTRRPFVYFQCDVVVCDVGDDDAVCRRNCSKGADKSRAKRSILEDDERATGHVIQGPVIVENAPESNDVVESDVNMAVGEIVHFKLPFGKGDKVWDQEIFVDSNEPDQSRDERSQLPVLVLGGLFCLIIGCSIGFLLSLKIRKNRRSPADV